MEKPNIKSLTLAAWVGEGVEGGEGREAVREAWRDRRRVAGGRVPARHDQAA
jgi:hypothetical protein